MKINADIRKSVNHLNYNVYFWKLNISHTKFNPIHVGPFRGCSRMGEGGQKGPLPKIFHTYPTMMKLPYLKKIQKIYESRDTLLEFCLTSAFFDRKSANFAISRNTDIDYILIHNFKFFFYFF